MAGPIGDAELRWVMNALGLALEQAVRGASQSSALAELLVSKGLVDRADLDAAMLSVQPETKRLTARLKELAGVPPQPLEDPSKS